MKEYNVGTASTSSTDDVVTLNTESYDLTELNVDDEVQVDDPTTDSEEQNEKNPLDVLKTMFSRIIEIIKTIVSYLTKTEVVK